MSSGWSLWVMFLVVLNLGITLFLFLWGPRAKIPTLPDGTTGHVWAHGVLREGMHRLPTWWVVFSAAMFVAAFAYLLLFPGFGSFQGLLGWTSHKVLAHDVAHNHAKFESLANRLKAQPVAQLATDPDVLRFGQRLFGDNCAACHGAEGKGNPLLGAPNLTDDYWLYGGTDDNITASIRSGRNGVMPGWAALGEPNVKNLTQYVLSLSGAPHDPAAAVAAEPLFKSTCAACHGAEGKGNPLMGAPALTDSVWLYGGTPADIQTSIHDGRQGHMPAWSPRLDDDTIRALTAYVRHLSEPGTTHASAH